MDSSVRAAVARGDALLAVGRSADAATEYRRALAVEPDDISTLMRLARALSADGHHDESIDHAKRAVALAPDDWRGTVTLAELQLMAGVRDEEPMSWARRAVELGPDIGHCWYILVECALWARDFETARDAADRCATTGAISATLSARGRLALAEARKAPRSSRPVHLATAREAFERRLAEDPENGWVHEQLAAVHRLSSNEEEEKRHLRAAERDGHHHVRARLREILTPVAPIDLLVGWVFMLSLLSLGAGVVLAANGAPVGLAVAATIAPPVLAWLHQDPHTKRRQEEAPPLLKLAPASVSTRPAILLATLASCLTAVVVLTWPVSDRPPSDAGSPARPQAEPARIDVIPATPSSVIELADGSEIVIPGRPEIVIPRVPRPTRIEDRPDPLEEWRVERFATHAAATFALAATLGAGVYASRRQQRPEGTIRTRRPSTRSSGPSA